MPNIIQSLNATPQTFNSQLLQIPGAGNFQILKYILDFSNLALNLYEYVLTPNSQQTFSCARMLRIDARWLLTPVTISISDSLADNITVQPGEYVTLHLNGLITDSYTIVLDNSAGPANRLGYLQLYFYNYLDITAMKRHSKVSQQLKAVLTPSSLNTISFYGQMIAPGKGLPVIERIDAFVQFGNSTNGFGLLSLKPDLVIGQNPLGLSSWDFIWSSGGVVVQSIQPNILLPPSNMIVSPNAQGADGLYAYAFNIGVSVTGAPIAGQAVVYINFRFD